MDLSGFISNFAAQFEQTPAEAFTAGTEFRKELKEWDSLIALSIIAMIDAEYKVKITGADFLACKTIEDVYKLVASRR